MKTETGVIYCDDNLARLARLPAESVDLVYLDPPFFSNQNYEVIWGDEAEMRSFEDRWRGGVHVYIEWMRHRLVELHRVLTPTGSLYLHCDPTASHYLKVMLDDVFGPPMFRSEVIWKRTSAHSDGKQGRRQHGRIHDTILCYSKGNDWTWNTIYTPYEPAYIEAFYKHVEPGSGRRYRLGDLTGPGGESNGNPQYEVMGVTRFWRYTREKMDALIAAGRVVQTRPGAVPQYKRYLDEMKGVPLQDVWTDIKPIGPKAAERLGYPTQKPEALLARIIETSTNPGDVVLDPFCGCGTTIAVAEQLRRKWIGIDISLTAVKIMQWRMAKLGAQTTIDGLPKTEADLKRLKPFEFQNWVISRFNGKHAPRKSGDFGVDGYSFLEHLPIQVKQSEKVGRVVIDNFETAIKRERKAKGYVVAFSFTKNSYEEVARAKRQEGIEIVLVPVSHLLEGHATVPVAEADQMVHDLLPLNVPNRSELPTAEELVASDLSTPRS